MSSTSSGTKHLCRQHTKFRFCVENENEDKNLAEENEEISETPEYQEETEEEGQHFSPMLRNENDLTLHTSGVLKGQVVHDDDDDDQDGENTGHGTSSASLQKLHISEELDHDQDLVSFKDEGGLLASIRSMSGKVHHLSTLLQDQRSNVRREKEEQEDIQTDF